MKLAKMFGRQALTLFAGLILTLKVVADDHPCCYWTGAVDASVDTPGNWKDESGNVLTAKPVNESYLVFTNIVSDLTVTTTASSYEFYGYIARNCTADIKLDKSKAIKLQAGGVTQESSSGTFWLDYSVTAWNGTNVINVVNADAMVAVQNAFNAPSPKTDEVVVKRGAGTFLTVNAPGSKLAAGHSKFVLEEGVWKLQSSGGPSLTSTELVFDGPKGVFDIAQDCTMTGVKILETDRATGEEYGFVGSGLMTFTGSTLGDMAFHGRFGGGLSLNWKPNSANRVLTLSEAQHSTTGNVIVSVGTIALTEGASFRCLNELEVGASATFSMATGTGVVASQLTVAEDSVLSLAAGSVMVADRLMVSGVEKGPGVYTAQNASWISGAGAVRIGDRLAIWTGGGSSSALTDPENWGGSLPDLMFGSTVLKFPAGARVSVPGGTASCVKGLVLAGADIVFEGAGSIAVGANGIATLGTGVHASIGCPIVLNSGDVSLSVGSDCEVTFQTNGFSAGADVPDANATLSGAGVLVFAAGAEPKNLGLFTIASDATVKIAADAGPCVTSLSTLLVEGGTLVVERDYQPGKSFTWNGTVRLKHGNFGSSLKSDGSELGNLVIGANADLEVVGPDAKGLCVYGNTSCAIRNYTESVDARGSMSFLVMTSKSPTLTIKGTHATRFSGQVNNTAASGTYNLVWQPTDGMSELTVESVLGKDSVRGCVKAASGKICFADGGSPLQCQASAASGATLAFAPNAGAISSDGKVVLDSGATLFVATGRVLDLPSGSLTVGGAVQADGQYLPQSTATWLAGGGIVQIGDETIEAVEKTWTGEGTTSSLTDPDNWGGSLPDFTSGALVATFPIGAEVVVPNDGLFRFYGICVSESATPGAVLIRGGQILLGRHNFVIPGSGHSVTVDCPVGFSDGVTVDRGENELVFTENAVLSSPIRDSPSVTFSGKGLLALHATSPEFGSACFYGTVDIYANNALGGAQATSTQSGNSEDDVLRLHGCSLDCKLNISGANRLTHLKAVNGVQNLNGLVTATDANEGRFACESGAELHFRGGVKYTETNNGSSWSPVSSYAVHVDNKPMLSTRVALGSVNDGDECSFYLNVASNRFPRGVVFCNDKAMSNILYTTVPYALYADGASGVTFGESVANAVWDLCGCDQGVGVFFSRTTEAVVTSDTPATLHLVDDELNYVKKSEMGANYLKVSLLGTASQVDRTCFAGAAGFSKEGSLTHYMMGVSTSTGMVFVSKGRLVFTRRSSNAISLPQEQELTNAGDENTAYTFTPLTGSWRKARAVVVSGGVLQLQHGAVFSKATDVVVSGSGKIELDAGVTQRCHSLSVGGSVYTDGTWGATGSGAEHVDDDHFAGGGCLQIVGEGFGVIIVVR